MGGAEAQHLRGIRPEHRRQEARPREKAQGLRHDPRARRRHRQDLRGLAKLQPERRAPAREQGGDAQGRGAEDLEGDAEDGGGASHPRSGGCVVDTASRGPRGVRRDHRHRTRLQRVHGNEDVVTADAEPSAAANQRVGRRDEALRVHAQRVEAHRRAAHDQAEHLQDGLLHVQVRLP